MVTLQSTLLHEGGYAVDDGILLILVGMISGTKVYAEKASERLPEPGAERPEESLHDIKRSLIRLPIDKFEHHLALILGHLLDNRLILFEDVLLECFKVSFSLFLVGNSLDILVGLAERREG